MADMLTKHFSRKELACPHCGSCLLKAELLLGLEELRNLVNVPLRINSGYRCEEHNKRIGGEKSSKHCSGEAADVALPSGMTLKEFYEVAQKVAAFSGGGIGAYQAGKGQHSSFLHLDVRATPARWSRVNGKYLAIGEAFK